MGEVLMSPRGWASSLILNLILVLAIIFLIGMIFNIW
jgi:hypothetical protein